MPLQWLQVASDRLQSVPFLFLALVALVTIDLKQFSAKPDELLAVVLLNAAILCVCGILQVVYEKVRVQQRTMVVDARNLVASTRRVLGGFKGSLLIYNVELNTFENLELWRSICQNPHISEIRLALPPKLVARMERLLRDNPELLVVLLGARDRFIVMPVSKDPKWERIGFALFLRSKEGVEDLKTSRCFVFPKAEPFSHLGTHAGTTGDRWEYRRFLETDEQSVLHDCVDHIREQTLTADAAFGEGRLNTLSIEDVELLAKGEPLTIEAIQKIHGLRQDQVKKFKTLVHDTASLGRPRVARRGELTVLTFDTARGQCILKFKRSADEKPRPLALWLPPWKVAKWEEFTEKVDEKLGEQYTVGHLEFCQRTDAYTFTGASRDTVEILDALTEYGEPVGILASRPLLLGVSVNAFVAAEVGAELLRRREETTDTMRASAHRCMETDLCLLMPSVDLFESIDNLLREARSTELISRRIYLGKPGFTANQLGGQLLFFETDPLARYCFLDLMYRGALPCQSAHLIENLQSIRKSGAKVLVGHSRQDSMTTWDDVSVVCKEVGISDSLHEISWRHEPKAGIRYVEDLPGRRRKRRAEDGIDALLEALLTTVPTPVASAA